MRIIVFLLLLATTTLYGQQSFDDFFISQTLRIDYVHRGDAFSEEFIIKRGIAEPLWGGTKTNLIDTFDFGHHKFSVFDSLSGKLLYSRGFSSLFVEWQYSEEAKTHKKDFYGSVVMPLPLNTVQIIFSSRNTKNKWIDKKAFYINPHKDIKPFKNKHIYDVVPFAYSGEPSEKLDIVFIAEGYTAEEANKFIEDGSALAQKLLETEPFQSNKENINIWGVKAISKESGISNPAKGKKVNTVLGAAFNTFGIERYLMVLDHYTMRDVASNAHYDYIYVVANTSEFGGGGIYNFFGIGTARHYYSDFLFFHEFGHTFGGLADEYESDDPVFENFYLLCTEPWEANITTLVDFESKWQSQVKSHVPVPTPIDFPENVVGAFEGAGYSSNGIYRPMKNCIMRSVSGRQFCDVCRFVMEQKINFYAE